MENDWLALAPRDWTEIYETRAGCGPELGVSFVEASLLRRRVDLGGGSLSFEVEQDLKLGLGGCVWECGLSMSEFFAAYPRFVRGKCVVDCGAGTGVVGLAAAKCDALEVTLTDLPSVLRLTERNARLFSQENGKSTETSGKGQPIRVRSLNWSTLARRRRRRPQWLRQINQEIVILCSDCLYDKSAIQSLTTLLRATLWLRPGSYAILGYKKRHEEPEKYFFENLMAMNFFVGILAVDTERGVYIILCSRSCRV